MLEKMADSASDDELRRLSKLASKISRYIDGDRHDKLKTVLEVIRNSTYSLASLDGSGVGKIIKKLSKRDDSTGHAAGKLIKKWKKLASFTELEHASSSEVKSEPCDDDVAVNHKEQKRVHSSELKKLNEVKVETDRESVSKALTQDKLAEAERIDPAYAAILQKLYATTSLIPDDDAQTGQACDFSVHDVSNYAPIRRNETSRMHASPIIPHTPSRHLGVATSKRGQLEVGLDSDAQFEIKRSSGHSQLYSGARRRNESTVLNLPANMPRRQRQIPSLQTLCLSILKENINYIDELGPSVAYHIIKPVLEVCDVQQLLRIEEANAHLYADGDTNELWKRHAQRDFPKAEVSDAFVHKRSRKRTASFTSNSDEEAELHHAGSDDDEEPFIAWRHIYFQQLEERERNFQRVTARIQQNKRDREDPMRRTKTAEIIGSGVIRAPRDVRRSQVANGGSLTAVTTLGNGGGASALARQLVGAAGSSAGAAAICTTSKGRNAGSDAVVQLSLTGGARVQKLQKRSFAPLMAKSLKMLKR